ncbi:MULTISPECIES: ABC transporter permease [Alcaligenes]|uniref:ABC transporter permease n=1 Tax=Alcaligenes TaxID=507 RepID=UPI0003B61C94|nr:MULTISPECIES: iron ABC transporter permease [Alcaligenes]ERT55215.1 iron ABC transporter permease [Alcaligenes sp. EGD-AK7]HRO21463.1 iron ABC transporter permease [Alcaligenes phenolicus]HRP15667.1 iron ABC transporter permease [Alcaligenes phenolicus]
MAIAARPLALRSPWFLPALVCLVVLVFWVVWPLASLFYQSVIDPATGLPSLHGFETFFSDPRYVEAFFNTIKLGLISTIGTLLLGAPLAYVVARYDFPGKAIVAILPLTTIVLPDIIVSQAWLMLLGNNGVVRLALESIGIDLPSFYGWFGMSYVLILNDYTYVYIGMLAALKAIDGTLEEAAVNLGASNFKRALSVTFPVLMPALLVNAMIVFTLAVDNFSIPMILGGQVDVLSSLTYTTFLSEMSGNPTMQGVLAVVSVILVGAVLFIQKRVLERKTFQMQQGRAPRPVRAQGLAGILLTVGAVLFVTFSLIPAFIVLIGAFTKASGPVMQYGTFTLDNMERALRYAPEPILNSLMLASVATLAGTCFATICSYLIVKKRLFVVTALDYMVMLPLAISGTVLGIALIQTYNSGMLVLTGTWVIMAGAYFVRKVPFSIRSASASLYNIPDSIEEASINLGVSPFQSFFKVVLPLMKPAILGAAILMWVTSLAEISATIVLYYGGMETMPIQMFRQIDAGFLARASAYGVILMVVILVPIYLAIRFLKLDLFSSR